MTRNVCIILLLLVLSACGARKNTPDTRFYTLEYETPAFNATPSKAIINLARFGVAPEFNTAKIVYRDLSFGRQEYAYHQWRGTPPVLVMDYLRRDMQKSGLFQAVSGVGSAIRATHQVEGIVEQWLEQDAPEHWQATAELTITLLDQRTAIIPDKVLFQRTYKESLPCTQKDPAAVVEAMSRVMQKLSERIITDVYQAVR